MSDSLQARFDAKLRTHQAAPPPCPATWLGELGRWLLQDLELVIAGRACRMLEVEAYLAAPWHADPFAHRHLTQAASNTWYFHRTGPGYCGGSYKGLDLTFGHHSVYGGLLVRAVELDDGQLVEGPSRLVDHLLSRVGAHSVFALDTRLMTRLASDPTSPLHLRERAARAAAEPILATARVGLTLRRAGTLRTMPAWWLRRYRYTTAAARLRKARIHQIAALALDGASPAAIVAATGARPDTVSRALTELERGRAEASLEPFLGQPLRASDLARAHGAWHALYARQSCAAELRQRSETRG